MEFSKGRFRVRLSQRDSDVVAAQRLRHRAFRGSDGVDEDGFDGTCQHLLIETVSSGDLVGTCRLHLVRSADLLAQTYTGQFYDLSVFNGVSGPFLELGRFCMSTGTQDGDALRLAWAALTRIVDGEGVALLFGCSSFPGTDPAPHSDALAALACHHLAPQSLRPGRKAAETVPLRPVPYDARRSVAQMPPLLRSYLAMGGWVSDHAVVDRDLGTLHVCTGVEIAAIPPSRARLLRADAG